MAAADSTAFRALSDVVLAIASEHEVEPVLQRLVDSARELGGARYAALGIPDGEGAFASFITSGMSDELIEAMGPLPRTHGMLGAMLDSAEPHLTDDITADPRFRGWWPRAHPMMRSFLGVPIVARGEVIGALYLTEKEDGSMFSLRRPAADRAAGRARRDRDRERAPARAQPRAEHRRGAQPARARAARLASPSGCSASRWPPSRPRRCSSATAKARPPSSSACQRARARRDGGAARGRLRAAARVAGGRGPGDRPAQARRGAAARVGPADRAAGVRRAAARRPARRRRCCGSPRRRSATRCATPAPSGSRCGCSGDDGKLVLQVTDDGCGFDPAGPEVRGQRLGLTSMEERATELGGTLDVTSTLGDRHTVRLELPT